VPSLARPARARAATQTFPANQPYSSYWHPSTLLSWSPVSDPDAEFNRGAVPLADRFSDPATQANAHARAGEGRVTAIAIMNPSTSNNPSQGSGAFDVNTQDYWPYVDLLVMWGGSAGEGLILSPSADVIAAAHRNGVPVLGTIFLPPTAFGGQLQWVWDLIQRTGSTYPVADKLIEVANEYGFDGWFLNQETAGGDSVLANQTRDFMKYFETNKPAGMHLMWYDAMIFTGQVSWQNELNNWNKMFFGPASSRASDEMFLNFGWGGTGKLAASRTKAQTLGRDPYDVYAGIDVQANGYSTNADWASLFPEAQPHTVSLGFYGSEWPYSSAAGHADYQQRASRFWVGANRDPSNTSTADAWKGIAHYVPERSPINDVPFVTSFGSGQGHVYAVDGAVLAASDWNNRALADVLPTWRWIAQSSGTPLVPDLDWGDAYLGGTCLRVTGALDAANATHVKLYRTRLALAGGENVSIAYKIGAAGAASHMSVGLAFEDDPATFAYLPVDSAASAGWNTQSWSLAAYAGRTIAIFSLQFESADPVASYDMKVGRIAVIDGAVDIPAPPSNAAVTSFVKSDSATGSLRMRWSLSPDATARYHVYRVNPDASRTFLGGTPNTAYFVSRIARVGAETATTIEVRAVGIEFGESAPETTQILWDFPSGVDGGSRGGDGGARVAPAAIDLGQNEPNPFGDTTRIPFRLSAAAPVSLVVYDAAGRTVGQLLRGARSAGPHAAEWDGRDESGRAVAPGVYFYRLHSGAITSVRKMLLVR